MIGDLGSSGKPRRKVDYEALSSPLNRIPSMDLAVVRDLIDVGVREVDDLRGRAPEVLLEEVRKLRPETPGDRIGCLRMAVYYAETAEPDPALLFPWKW
jgi:hypothetical protein